MLFVCVILCICEECYLTRHVSQFEIYWITLLVIRILPFAYVCMRLMFSEHSILVKFYLKAAKRNWLSSKWKHLCSEIPEMITLSSTINLMLLWACNILVRNDKCSVVIYGWLGVDTWMWQQQQQQMVRSKPWCFTLNGR